MQIRVVTATEVAVIYNAIWTYLDVCIGTAESIIYLRCFARICVFARCGVENMKNVYPQNVIGTVSYLQFLFKIQNATHVTIIRGRYADSNDENQLQLSTT